MRLNIGKDNSVKLTLALLLVVVYLIPNLFHFWKGESGTVLLRDDEFSYAARILRVQQGYLQVGNDWSWENRNDPSLIPNLPELTLASVSKIIPGEFEIKILFLRAILILVLFFTFQSFTAGFTQTSLASSLIAAWILSDPGLLFYKPLIAAILPDTQLPLNRFTNPLFGLSVFFLTMLMVQRTFSESGKRRDAVFAGLLLAAQFYISVYYWTHAILWTLAAVVFSTNKNRWSHLFLGIAVVSLCAIPYLLHSLEVRKHPVFATIAWRNGLLLKERGWYLLGHKTIYLFLALAGWKIFSGSYKSRFLASGVLTGGLLYFSSIVTGITFQNFHWHYTLAPVAFLLGFVCLPALIQRRDSVLLFMAIVSMVCGGIAGIREYNTNIESKKLGSSLIGKGYEESLRWIRDHSDPESVILTGAFTSPHIPLKTERRVLYNTIVQFVSAQEVLLHHQLFWYLHGWSGEELRSKIHRANPVLAQFEYGFTTAQEEHFRSAGYPPISLSDMERLSEEVSAIQQRIEPAYFRDFLSRKKVDYILIGENESDWENRIGDLFETEKVFQTESARIYKVKGTR